MSGAVGPATPVYPRPSLASLIIRITQQLQAKLPGTDPALRRSVAQTCGMVFAQELQAAYGYLDFIARQSFVSECEGIYLDLKGNPVGVYRKQAVAAAGAVTFSGTNGQAVAAGAVLQSADGSQQYATASAATIASGTAVANVTSLTGGAAGNQPTGAPLTLVVAIAGINPQAVVNSPGLTGGIDLESDTAYRVRVLQRLQLPPQGGAKRDYVTWCKEVAGVTRVWVWPLNRGNGTADWSAVFDGQAPASILPNSTQISAIQAVVDTNLPANAVSSQNQTLTVDTINVSITNLVIASGYTRAQAVANVTTSLQNLFASTTPGGAPYGDGIANGSTGGTLALELISDAVTQSEGVGTFDLSSPTADVVSATYHFAQFGTLSASP